MLSRDGEITGYSLCTLIVLFKKGRQNTPYDRKGRRHVFHELQHADALTRIEKAKAMFRDFAGAEIKRFVYRAQEGTVNHATTT
jgi:hypothetical protein